MLCEFRAVKALARLAARLCAAPTVRARRRADLQVVSVRRRGVIALVRRRVDVASAAGIHAGRQTALLELGLHLIGIERRDAERDVSHPGAAGRRRRARASAAIAAAAADDDAADVADLALILAALVGSRLPTEERRVERDGLLVVRDLE